MWMKVDDRLHSHRKTRTVTKSHADKTRDIAPMGLWVAAGSWAAQNGKEGWVPEDELDRWDDDWKMLAARLVDAGFWWPEDLDGEAGYGFHDWHDYNPSIEAASASGEFGNHVRWHVNRSKVDPECAHCPKEPDDPESHPDIPPDSGGDIGGRSGGDIGGDIAPDIGGNRLTRPDPNPNPTQKDTSSARADIDADFLAWYAEYPRKEARGAAVKAYRAARKKTDPATLLAAIRSQTPRLLAGGKQFTPLPASWLNAERWLDEPVHGDVITDPAQLPPVEKSWMRR